MTTDLPSIEECNRAISDDSYEIGSGKDRVAYRIPGSKWVYKVDDSHNHYINKGEIERYKYITNNPHLIPDNLYFPEMHLLANGVVAAEYIDGKEPRSNSDKLPAIELSENIGWHDSSAYCNTRIVTDDSGNKRVYIIDLGE